VDNLLPHEPTVLDKALARMVVNPADWIFTMSQAVSADAREHTGINPRRTLFHPLYGLFADQIPSAEARQALSLDERPVLLFFGLIRPYKGLDDYLRALADLKKRQVEFQGLVVGESYEDPGKYHKLINDLALSDDVRFVDQFVPDNEVPVYFSAADVLVLPYRSATQSGIVGIAFQQDRPVIATRVGGLDEYVTEGVTGYLVPPEDPAALAERLEFFIRHNEAQPMSENVARMKSRFGINRFCRELLEALDE